MQVLGRRYRAFGMVATLILVIALYGVVLTGCGGDDSVTLNGMTRVPPANTDSLTLPDESPGADGNEIAVKGPDQGLMLLYFGYTSCPDVCPTSMADLRLALSELDPQQRGKIRVAMVTVDPKRDTGPVLNEYLGYFFEAGEFHSLRSEQPEALARVEAALGASHRLGKPDSKGDYEVDHTAQIFAIDDRGEVEVEWAFGTEPELIADDLKILLETSENTDA